MRTISWKHSLVALFAVAAFAACSDDTSAPPATDAGDAGNPCGNGKIDKGEDCDGTKLNNVTCSSMSMGMKSGTLKCSKACKFDTSGCTSGGGGAGGGGGMGTGGIVGTGGSVGGSSGMKGDAGPDSGDAGGKKDGGGKTDSGGGKT